LRLVRCWWARVADAAELVAEAGLHVVRAAIAWLASTAGVSGYARTDLGSMGDSGGRLRADLGLARGRRGGRPGTTARGWMALGRRERGGPRLVGEPERGANLERLGGAVTQSIAPPTADVQRLAAAGL
jgi:hypothetical protein